MQRHRWVIDNIWILTAHWCPVGPRVLDTCSEIERANHRWGVWAPPSIQYLIPSTVLGATKQFGALLLFCTYAMLYCFIYDCARSTCTVQDRDPFSLYRQAQEFRVPSRLQPAPQTLSPSRRLADFVAGVLSGVAPRACFGSGKRHDLGPADIPMGVC